MCISVVALGFPVLLNRLKFVTMIIYFDAQIVLDLARRIPFKLTCLLLTCPYDFFSISFLIFWPPHKKDVSVLFSVFPVLVLESTIFPRNPVPFNGEWYLEINTWCQVYLFLLGIMASRTSQSYRIYECSVHTGVCMHMCVHIYVSMSIFVYVFIYTYT